MQEMARTNEPAAAIELTLRVLNGEIRQAEVTSARTWWHGSPAVVTVFRDLTERRRAETALSDVEERYAAVVEQAPMGMHFYRLDSEGRLIFTGANKAAGDILGSTTVRWSACPSRRRGQGSPVPRCLSDTAPSRARAGSTSSSPSPTMTAG